MSLNEIRARLEAATPGEWFIWFGPNSKNGDWGIGAPDDSIVAKVCDFERDDSGSTGAGNAALIANAPSDIRELLGLVERLAEFAAGSCCPFAFTEGNAGQCGNCEHCQKLKELLAELAAPGEDETTNFTSRKETNEND